MIHEFELPLDHARDLVVLRHRLRERARQHELRSSEVTRLCTAASDVARPLLDRAPVRMTIRSRPSALELQLEGADWQNVWPLLEPFCELASNTLRVTRPVVDEDQSLAPMSALHGLQLRQRELFHAHYRAEAATAEVRRANRALTERQEQLARVNADLEMIAAAAAHDLREPLQVIGLFAGILEGQPDAAEHATRIRAAATRMGSMLTGLMSLARVGAPPPDTTSLSRAVSNVRDDLGSRLTATGGTLRQVGEATVPTSAAHLRGILQNLVSNGLKYHRPGVPPVVTVHAEPGGYLVVSDNGRGIPAERASTLFQLFRRLDRDREVEGTGVGLALVHRLIEAYGGTISIEPNEPEGTSFRIHFPRSGPQAR